MPFGTGWLFKKYLLQWESRADQKIKPSSEYNII